MMTLYEYAIRQLGRTARSYSSWEAIQADNEDLTKEQFVAALEANSAAYDAAMSALAQPDPIEVLKSRIAELESRAATLETKTETLETKTAELRLAKV